LLVLLIFPEEFESQTLEASDVIRRSGGRRRFVHTGCSMCLDVTERIVVNYLAILRW